jgi:hypothetical protein
MRLIWDKTLVQNFTIILKKKENIELLPLLRHFYEKNMLGKIYLKNSFVYFTQMSHENEKKKVD